MVHKAKLTKGGNVKLSNETLDLLNAFSKKEAKLVQPMVPEELKTSTPPTIGTTPMAKKYMLSSTKPMAKKYMLSTKPSSPEHTPADTSTIVLATNGGSASSPSTKREPFEYNQRIAALLASVSGWSYATLDDFKRILSDNDQINLSEADFVEFSTRNDSIFVAATAQIIRTSDKKTAIVCFRGTEPTNPINWGTDLNGSLVPYLAEDKSIRVHRGFLNNFRSVWDGSEGILSYLKNPAKMNYDYEEGNESKFQDEPELENIFFTGHSLGGAMAFLGGLYTSYVGGEMWNKVRGVYTYGQPMVIPPESVKKCDKLFGESLFRHVYFNDIVPHVPPLSFGPYEHIGREFRYRPHKLHSWQEIKWGKVSQLPLALPVIPFMLGDAVTSTGTPIPFPKSPWSIIDHLPLGYMNSLNAAVKSNDTPPDGGLKAVVGHTLSIVLPFFIDNDEVRDPMGSDDIANENGKGSNGEIVAVKR